MKGWVIAAALLGAPGFGMDGLDVQQAVELRVTPQSTPSPGTVRATAFVEPNDENVELVLVADSGTYYSSSTVALDGEQAPRTHTTVLKHLPPGEYEVTASVERADGDRVVDRVTLTVWK